MALAKPLSPSECRSLIPMWKRSPARLQEDYSEGVGLFSASQEAPTTPGHRGEDGPCSWDYSPYSSQVATALPPERPAGSTPTRRSGETSDTEVDRCGPRVHLRTAWPPGWKSAQRIPTSHGSCTDKADGQDRAWFPRSSSTACSDLSG